MGDGKTQLRIESQRTHHSSRPSGIYRERGTSINKKFIGGSLQTRDDGRRGSHRAGLINIHGDEGRS